MFWITNTLITTFLLTTIYCFKNELKVYTSDTFPHDGIKRFLYSANVSEIDVVVLPKHQGTESPLSSVLQQLDRENFAGNDIVLYCESYMTVLAGSTNDVINLWKETKVSVLVDLTQDDSSLKLNCILGQNNHLIKALKYINRLMPDHIGTITQLVKKINSDLDFSISIDASSKVFLNMDQYPDMIGYTSDYKKFHNFETNHNPAILIGSTTSYTKFNQLTNYVPGIFDMEYLTTSNTKTTGKEHQASSFYRTKTRKEQFSHNDNYTTMITSFLIKEDHPFLDMSLDRFRSLSWGGKRRIVAIFNTLPHREHIVSNFFVNMKKRNYQYAGIRYFNSSSIETKSQAAMHATIKELCYEFNCTWVYTQNSDVVNIHYDTLEELVSWNLTIIAPFILSNINKEYPVANFWGNVVDNGFYARSDDYFDIVQRKIGGILMMPYITGAYLIRGDVNHRMEYNDSRYNDRDSDVVFCNSVRKSGHLMFLKAKRVDSVFINGRTAASEPHPFFEFFPENHTPFYTSFYMKWDHFRSRDKSFDKIKPEDNPCEDVYIRSLFSENFVIQMRNKAVTSDSWNSRVWTEGWQNIETVAFHDIGLNTAWDDFSKDYLPTLVNRLYKGFYSDALPIFTFFMRMNNETIESELLEGKGIYTVLIPLTNNTIDYYGKGILFNEECSFNPNIGDLVIFPSRLTHTWKPLAPANGTMINLVSFYS